MATNQDKVKELIDLRNQAKLGGGEKRIESQHKKGKYTARERIAMLLDEDSFEEFDMFVTHRCNNFGMEKTKFLGDGVVTGQGTINGRIVFVFAQDFTVFGGALSEMLAQKICKVMDKAMTVGAPIIGLNDSGGARIQEGVNSLAGYAEIFERNILASGVIPQISAIFGPCAGGAVYSPALTDFILMTDQSSYMFVTGPKVVKTVTGEDISTEDLGGAEVHSTKSGVSHFMVENEEEGISLIRDLLSYLPSNNLEEAPMMVCNDPIDRLEDKLNSLIPDNPNLPYNMLEVIEAIVDQGKFLEVHKRYARNIIVGFCRMGGRSVGIIANQPSFYAGVLDIESSRKAARFVRFCDCFNIPILTLTNVEGFATTVEEEKTIASKAAILTAAFAEADVPKVNLITGNAYGSAYITMNSKHIGADMVFALPDANIGMMDAQVAAKIMYADDKDADISAKAAEFAAQSGTQAAAARGYVDSIIAPEAARKQLIFAFELLFTKSEYPIGKKHGTI